MARIAARKMVKGLQYRILKKYDHLPVGTVVEFSREGQTGYMICHPPDEPDMQSCIAINKDDEVETIS